ncbi:hypothetical protein Mal64_28320 [Pseudobythopirellula maris]|uniref:FHA domain-containing protein n=1 Tax=Pseudobythopirellula maris TaxID=2527991 RepID=A0A5C5ZIV2_9BACT|nr:FHA domain-containing protein [Pseudobythopirellula maris]TWT87294.1 hypothetical protein Mal64_28320 [Pseudobythopirellula maris]
MSCTLIPSAEITLPSAAARLGLKAYDAQGQDACGAESPVWALDQVVTIGSGPRCSLRLRGPGLKPLHCVVTPTDQGPVVRRWASGTLLNGQSFTESPIALGDRLSVGEMTVEIIEQEDPDAREGFAETAEVFAEESLAEEQNKEQHEATAPENTAHENTAHEAAVGGQAAPDDSDALPQADVEATSVGASEAEQPEEPQEEILAETPVDESITDWGHCDWGHSDWSTNIDAAQPVAEPPQQPDASVDPAAYEEAEPRAESLQLSEAPGDTTFDAASQPQEVRPTRVAVPERLLKPWSPSNPVVSNELPVESAPIVATPPAAESIAPSLDAIAASEPLDAATPPAPSGAETQADESTDLMEASAWFTAIHESLAVDPPIASQTDPVSSQALEDDETETNQRKAKLADTDPLETETDDEPSAVVAAPPVDDEQQKLLEAHWSERVATTRSRARSLAAALRRERQVVADLTAKLSDHQIASGEAAEAIGLLHDRCTLLEQQLTAAQQEAEDAGCRLADAQAELDAMAEAIREPIETPPEALSETAAADAFLPSEVEPADTYASESNATSHDSEEQFHAEDAADQSTTDQNVAGPSSTPESDPHSTADLWGMSPEGSTAPQPEADASSADWLAKPVEAAEVAPEGTAGADAVEVAAADTETGFDARRPSEAVWGVASETQADASDQPPIVPEAPEVAVTQAAESAPAATEAESPGEIADTWGDTSDLWGIEKQAAAEASPAATDFAEQESLPALAQEPAPAQEPEPTGELEAQSSDQTEETFAHEPGGNLSSEPASEPTVEAASSDAPHGKHFASIADGEDLSRWPSDSENAVAAEPAHEAPVNGAETDPSEPAIADEVKAPSDPAIEGSTDDEEPTEPSGVSASYVDPFAAPEKPAQEEDTKSEPESYLDRYAHLLQEDGEAEASTPSPAATQLPPQPSAALGAGAAEPTDKGGEDDESIDDYMAKMMARIRGESAAPAPTPAPAPVRKPSPSETSAPEDAVETEPVAAAEPPAVAKVEFRGGPAPEKADALDQLRQLANQSARKAITLSDHNKGREKVSLNLGLGGVSIGFGCLLATMATEVFSAHMYAAAALILIGCGWLLKTGLRLLGGVKLAD